MSEAYLDAQHGRAGDDGPRGVLPGWGLGGVRGRAGDSDGASFRMGDTMLEEASVMVAMAQVCPVVYILPTDVHIHYRERNFHEDALA